MVGANLQTTAISALPSADFRGFMRQLPAGVGLVTTGAPGQRRGLTATAICSLSDDPPTILACVNRRAAAHDFIIDYGAFAVNMLGAEQEELARCFSGQTGLSGEDRFTLGNWAVLQTGAPILSGVVFALDCELLEHKAVATHTIFIGRVVAGCGHPRPPLVYHQGGYKLLPVGA